MPYRNIYEKDDTSSGRTQYANFAVLVPGFVDSNKEADDLFDINGVAKFTKQNDFVEKIGKVASNVGRAGYKPAVPAVAATILGKKDDTALWEVDPETGEKLLLVGKLLSAYTEAELAAVTAEVPTAWLATPKKKTEGIGEIGELQDEDYKYTIVNYGEHTTTDKYVIVTAKGNDAEPEVKGETINHYGNQIAYELLGLGYTVLYKRLTDVGELEDQDFYEGLEDKSVYDFRYVLTGLRAGVGLTGNSTITANNNISKLATSRNDILALVDIDENAYLNSGLTTQTQIAKSITSWINQATEANEYSAIVGPGLDLYLAEDNVYKNSTLPMSFYYLACAKYDLDINYKEWYAVAGYKRGVCKYVIKNPLLKVGEVLVNKLSPRTNTTTVDEVPVSKACNLVAQIRGNYYIWGNRTAFTLQADDLKAKHYLNIRQLIITIKKELYNILTSKTFNPNSDTLWFSFKSAITPLLDTMVSNDGILDYDIIRTTVAQKGTMAATLRIVPIEAVEDFEITISLENSLEETNTILE